jgi:hypothetical protein
VNDKVEEAVWLVRSMNAGELLMLRERLGDDWLPPPDIGVREPVGPLPPEDEAGAVVCPYCGEPKSAHTYASPTTCILG